MVRRWILKIIRSKERNKTAVITEPREIKWDDINNMRCEASRNFRNKIMGISESQN
jgi:hypothetical protein